MKPSIWLLLLAGAICAAHFGRGQSDPRVFQEKGVEAFKQGRIREAIAHWDKGIELNPGMEPYHWQRGIAYYYAGQFEKGRKQFELHQTVNQNDVENAVWHFLCVARASGLEEAKKHFIPIQGDARVPMMEVHALFAGKSTPERVLAKAKEGEAPERVLKNRLFYAHLYLGLWEEARGNADAALEHIRKAVNDYGQPHYMGDVARVHLRLANKRAEVKEAEE